MKKRIFTTFLIVMVLIISPIFLSACNEPLHTLEEFDNLYSSIKTDSTTKQFFEGNGDNLVVNFNQNKITGLSDKNNKNYIFNNVYIYYLQSSSLLFSSLMNGQTKPSVLLRNFKQEEVNNLYNNLEVVKSKLNIFADSKTVYEETEGNLYYKNILSDYNALISSLYNLNTTFADYYFNGVGAVNFSNDTLTDRKIRDMLAYQLMLTSKASFSYELVPMKIENPITAVSSYIFSTTQLNSFVENIAKPTLTKLNSSANLATSAIVQTVTNTFINLQNNADKYNHECNKFLKALQNFNVLSYQNADNKQNYLDNCTALERSSYNIIQNFLEGRYSATTQALYKVVTNIRI